MQHLASAEAAVQKYQTFVDGQSAKLESIHRELQQLAAAELECLRCAHSETRSAAQAVEDLEEELVWMQQKLLQARQHHWWLRRRSERG